MPKKFAVRGYTLLTTVRGCGGVAPLADLPLQLSLLGLTLAGPSDP